jgi:hypothetical protein
MGLFVALESSELKADHVPSGTAVAPERVANVIVVPDGSVDDQVRLPKAVTPFVSMTADVKMPEGV